MIALKNSLGYVCMTKENKINSMKMFYFLRRKTKKKYYSPTTLRKRTIESVSLNACSRVCLCVSFIDRLHILYVNESFIYIYRYHTVCMFFPLYAEKN